MGSRRWDAEEWSRYDSSNISSKSSVTGPGGIYNSTSLKNNLNPKGVDRESVDSADNPNSTPVIVGLDVTGSMQNVLEAMARKGLPTLATEIYNRKPVTDPHIMFMGIGDALAGDRAPLQVTQFEADVRIAEQLTDLWLEGHGGGNNSEGYILAWYFAAKHTKIDSMKKRGKKGYLITMGDDGPTPYITPENAQTVFGDTIEADITAEELLKIVSRDYEVFHLMVEEGGSHHSGHEKRWQELLGERAILLSDHTKMGEVIVSLLQVLSGTDKADVVSSWDGSTSVVVSKAINGLVNKGDNSTDLVEF